MKLPVVHKSTHYDYIRISEIELEYRDELEKWIFGQACPLIQGEEGALLDCVFFDDFIRFTQNKKLVLDSE